MGFLNWLINKDALLAENKKLKEENQLLVNRINKLEAKQSALELVIAKLNKLVQQNNISETSVKEALENAVNPVSVSEEKTSDLKDSVCQKQYQETEKHFSKKISEPQYHSGDEDDETLLDIPRIVPKDLQIYGYDDTALVIHKNFRNSGFGECYELPMIGYFLFNIGKEIILKRVPKRSMENEQKQNKEIIKLADIVSRTSENGDRVGHTRALNAFKEKYQISTDSLFCKTPSDFHQDIDMTSYECCCYLYEFLKYWKFELICGLNKDVIDRRKEHLEELLSNDIVFIQKVLDELYQLRKRGLTICIAPIFNKNILYRPKRAAQDQKYLSFLYYDKYVEIDDEELNDTTTSVVEGGTIHSISSYYGSEYVSGHYRQGHYRNGRWVSGGYVKGHYRSR